MPSKKTANKKTYKSQPTYKKMVQHVLLQNKTGKHQSPTRILANIKEVFPVESEHAITSIWKTLKAGAEEGDYVRNGNSFRLSPNCRARLSRKSTRKRRVSGTKKVPQKEVVESN